MYLSKLELFGFKSFANKTTIKFTKGITGIVGPNGCGKTNIVDALRWCLGEQKSSILRSDKMESVIFNGTRLKKPMGMSEVSLFLINESGILPSEYSEVKITRRIFRSGESEYLLNNNICRLKDITNLFMDTGMGTNAYSVIELKMVETILSNKAEERRRMFEEAAGVNKYKLRRRLSLKKLDEVKADLLRVNDIVSEVEKNVRSLERQAKRADKYNQMQSVLREKEILLAEYEYSKLLINKNSLANDKDRFTGEKTEIDHNIRNIEQELIRYRDRTTEIDLILKDKRNDLNIKINGIHELHKNISVIEERRNSLEKVISNYTSEIEDLENQRHETSEIINSNHFKIDELKWKLEEKQRSITAEESEVTSEKENLNLLRNELKAKSDLSLSRIQELNKIENELSALQTTHALTNQDIEKSNAKIQKLTGDIAKTVGFIEELENERAVTIEKLNRAESDYAAQLSEKSKLDKELSTLREKELELKNLTIALRDKIEFLTALIANFEGISEGAKILINNDDWTDREKTLFADVGTTEEKFRLALEASLKSVLNNLLVEDFDSLSRAVDYLKKNELGKASFFILRSANGTSKSLFVKLNEINLSRKRKKIRKEDSFVSWASDLVETHVKWRPYFNKVLSDTVITSDLASAFSLYSKYPQFNFATFNGDIIQSNGIIEAGSEPKLEETLFGRKKLLNDLMEQIPGHEREIEKIKDRIVEQESKISNIDLTIMSEQGRLLANEVNNIEKQISQLEFEKKKSSEEIDKIQDDIQDMASRSNDIDNRLKLLREKYDKLGGETVDIKRELGELEAKAKDAEELYNNNLSRLNSDKLDHERIKGEFQNLVNATDRSKEKLHSINSSIEKRVNDIGSSRDEINRLDSDLGSAYQDHKWLTDEKDAMQGEVSSIENQLTALKEEANKFETELNKLRSGRQAVSDSIYEIDLKLNEINLRSENLVGHISDEYNHKLEFKQFDDLDGFDFGFRANEVHDLKEKLKGLGPINLLAFSEYEEENERLQFLLKQRNDLIESEKDLIKTIHQINETAQELFRETFEQIRGNFKKIFRTLFDPGDEADLLIEEEADPLEAKIEITAKPKGKRPTSIELLSGGEKTLTATALLFAIYLVKPSPFCVLDEVDAPLDDANIDRFTKLLKEFSRSTQFIIVTHNKRTMEAAENMYGVTMQEEGVSKLVGVQFNAEINVN